MPNLKTDNILTSAFALFYVFWKVVRRTKIHPLKEVDLVTGKTQIDEMEGQWPDEEPKNILQKVSWMRISVADFTDLKASRFGFGSHDVQASLPVLRSTGMGHLSLSCPIRRYGCYLLCRSLDDCLEHRIWLLQAS